MVGDLLSRVCQSVANVIGDLPTILLVALSFGLILLLFGLAVSRTATYLLRKFAREATAYIVHAGKRYFQHLKWMGLTEKSCRIAVVCSLVAWFGVLVIFAFKPYWALTLMLIIALVVGFTVEGWRQAGKRKKPWRFVRAFYEPTFALTIPALAGKIVDAGLHSLAGS